MVQLAAYFMICWFFSIRLEALSYVLCGTAFLDSTDLIEQPIQQLIIAHKSVIV
jgi:hypothetical protein